MADAYSWWQRGIIYQIYPRSFHGLATATASAICPASPAGSIISPGSASTRSGSRRSTPRRWPTSATTLPTTPASTRCSARLADFDALVAEAHRARPQGHARFRAESHLRPSIRGSSSRAPRATSPSATGTSGATRRRTAGRPTTGSAFRRQRLDMGRDDRPVLLPRVPHASSPISTGATRRSSAAMLDVLRFWLDRGVDGFRVDVIWQMIKDDQLRDNPPNPDYQPGLRPLPRAAAASTPRTGPRCHDIIAAMRGVVDAVSRAAADRRDLSAHRAAGRPTTAWTATGMHLPFNFQLILTALARARASPRRSPPTRPRCRPAAGRTGCSATTTSPASPAASARRRRAWRPCCC